MKYPGIVAAEKNAQEYRRFMFGLEKWIRDNVKAVPRENEPLPDHELKIYVSLEDELGQLLTQHLPFLLTLLPAEIGVMPRSHVIGFAQQVYRDSPKDVVEELVKNIEDHADTIVRVQAKRISSPD